MPRRTAFEFLYLEESRLPKPWRSGAMGSMYLIWQVSPSFDLKCGMARVDDLDDRPAAADAYYSDPQRPVSGFTVIQHRPRPGCEKD
jgi:hypothetical protein